MLSREDEEGELQQQVPEERVEEQVERPKQRKRNVAALRSRKVKSSVQVRTRRTRATDW